MARDAEDALRRLEALRDPDWQRAAARRVERLRLRDSVAVLIEPRPTWPDDEGRTQHEAACLATAAELDTLEHAELEAVMLALHPGLGQALARWWVKARTEPYGRSWDRRAYRAAADGAAALTLEGRADQLVDIVAALGPFDADPPWLVSWGAHLVHVPGGQGVTEATTGSLLAAAVDLGGTAGQETLDGLLAVLSGDDPVAMMGRHVVIALLRCSDPRGWDAVERLLLAAQRQEGLRQVVLEAADEAHPVAFDRMLGLVLEHGLLRFAASVRAAGVWLGFSASVEDMPQVVARVTSLATCRGSETARLAALASGDAWESYLGLVAAAQRDVGRACDEADLLLAHHEPDVRAAAVRFLVSTGLAAAGQSASRALADPSVEVACLAAGLLTVEALELPETFPALEQLIPRLPVKARQVDGLGVELGETTVSRQAVAGRLIAARGARGIAAVLPWLSEMDSGGRWAVAHHLAGERELTPQLRAVAVELLADRSSSVREQAVQAVGKLDLAADEALAVEALLTRRGTDVRRASLALLARQPKPAARASAARLTASADAAQRRAGEELLVVLGDSPAASAGGGDGPHSDDDGIVRPSERPAARDVRAELLAATQRTPPVTPARSCGAGRGVEPDAVLGLLQLLDQTATEHRNTPVTIATWQGSTEMLLADVQWLPRAFDRRHVPVAASSADGGTGEDAAEGTGLVLADVFRPAFGDRPGALRSTGSDGLDALCAHVAAEVAIRDSRHAYYYRPDTTLTDAAAAVIGLQDVDLAQPELVRHVTGWLLLEHADTAVVDAALDGLEATLARVPATVLATGAAEEIRGRHYAWQYDWRGLLHQLVWLVVLEGLLAARPALFDVQQLRRWLGLMRWVARPRPDSPVKPIGRGLLVAAHDAGVATDGDVLEALLMPHEALLADFTRRGRTALAARHPRIAALADTVRDQVLEVELSRGDLPTATSDVALNLRSARGAGLCATLLAGLRDTSFSRGWTGRSDARDAVLSHLVRVCFPADGDTGAVLADAARARGVKDSRLIELAVYAPQWARVVEDAVGWPGLADAVLWLHAHTKDDRWSVDQEVREAWAALSAELTPLQAADLVAGAVDVEWFLRAHAALGPERWRSVDKVARLASAGSGHRRAQVFAGAMLGELTEQELITRLHSTRHQDSVRALGLVPLPDGAERIDAVMRRYHVLREFERGSRAFGNQRQQSERTAVRIGLDNLARTAGYTDPQRFSWEMEALEAGDLADGPVVVREGEVTVTLSVTDQGAPELTVRRGDKTLQAVPAALRKDPRVVELRRRKTELGRQASRVTKALEAAMVNADRFHVADIDALRRHPLVDPVLAQMVWIDQAGQTMRRDPLGVAVAAPTGRSGGAVGPGWADASGRPVRPDGALRLAHPTDLLASGSWIAWQERVFTDFRPQPFKQVFRELYVPASAETGSGPVSTRYDGHQVQPRQALALLAARSWRTDPDEGDTARVFHEHDIVAHLGFDTGVLTPAEVDLPAVAGVWFTSRGRRGAGAVVALHDVPPTVFSEAMRDVDLVVSVAHAGGVDPEATASTTQMRAALVRETARLLGLDNVELTDTHVLIDGRLGEYSVHLGSTVVHRRPGGSVCIVPVGSQYRGRLFLPFADNDPRTAELVSKVLLLAEDHKIKDPTILEQLSA